MTNGILTILPLVLTTLKVMAVACWQGGTMAPPAKIFRGRQTTTGALKLCKTKFSAKTLTLFKSHLEFIKEIYAFRLSKLVVLMPE